MTFFDAFKQYITKHPKLAVLKPTSDKYDGEKLIAIVGKLSSDELDCFQQDLKKIGDFVEISDYLHGWYTELYEYIKKDLCDLNMTGGEIIEFFIAGLNRDYKVVSGKIKEAMDQQPIGTYLYQDMMNPKLQLPNGDLVDTRAALEASTDSISLICNYLRFFQEKEFKNDEANPQLFAANIIRIFQMANEFVAFKHSYDDILYNGGFVKIDREEKQLTFDYDNYEDLKLLKVGDMMFGERTMHITNSLRGAHKKSVLDKYTTNFKIQRVNVQNGFVQLEFEQGEPVTYKAIALETDAAIRSFYEFLSLDITLNNLDSILLEEALAVWTALRYICIETFEQVQCDVSMFTKEQMGVIPRCFKKENIIEYIVKLTGIDTLKVKAVLQLLEVDWNHFNDIWTSPLMLIDDYYSIPFFPIVNCSLYNMIDYLLDKGGYDLDGRGTIFEKYIHQQIAGVEHKYEISSKASTFYGSKNDGEEIDLIVVLKNLVIIGEVKCIHYSMEAQDYYNAWERLEEGAEQAIRKTKYVETYPDLFLEVGETKGKKLLPVVITNYPTFTGFNHNGVFVIDSHSFLSYLNTGFMTKREMSVNSDPIRDIVTFYRDEIEYSANFELYLKDNPIKHLYMQKISIDNMQLVPDIEPWKCFSKTAVYNGHPGFNIVNG